MPLMQRFMRFMSRSGILSDARLLEMYPPFVADAHQGARDRATAGARCASGCL